MKSSVFFIYCIVTLAACCVVELTYAAGDQEILATRQSGREKTVQLTQSERAWLKAHPKIVLGYTDSFEPEVIVNADGSLRGILVDYLAELNKRLDVNIHLQIDPIPELLEKMQNKEIDGILSILPEYAKKLGLLKTSNILNTGYPAIIGRTNKAFTSPQDLAGKRVAVIDKVLFSEKIIEQYGADAIVIKVLDAKEGLQLVNSGQVDYFLGASLNAYLLRKYQLFDLTTQYVFYDHPIINIIGTRADWPEFSSILDKGLSSFLKEEIEAIEAKWIYISGKQKISMQFTAEEQAWLAENHVVQVRVLNIPPYIILKKGGEPEGISIDYLHFIAEQTGVKFQYIPSGKSFSQALDGLMQHKGPDLITSMMRTPEREKSILFSQDYFRSPYVIFSHKNDKTFISDISDLSGRKIALPKRTIIHEKITKDYPDLNLVLFDSDAQAIEAVAIQKADIYIGNLALASNIALEKGLSTLKISGVSPFGEHVLSMGIRNDWPELKSIVDKALASMPAQRKTEIRNKNISIQYDQTNLSAIIGWVVAFFGAAALVIVLFSIWNRSLKDQVEQRTAELDLVNHELEMEVVERKLAQNALEEKITEIMALINAVKDSFFLMKSDSTIIIANQSFAEQSGIPVSTLSGMKAYDLPSEGLLKIQRKRFVENVITSGQPNTFKGERDGRFYENRLYPVVEKNGSIEKLAVLASDITEGVLAEQKIKENEALFRATFEQAAVGIAHVSPEGNFLRLNQKFCNIVGYSLEEMMNLTFQEITHPDDLDSDIKRLRHLLNGEIDSYVLEKRYINKDGNTVWVKLRVVMVFDDMGKPFYLLSVIEDITEQKEGEEKLRMSEEYFSKAFHAQTVPMAIINTKTGKRIDFNDSYVELCGYSKKELQQDSLFSLVIWGDAQEQNKVLEKLIAERRVVNYPASIQAKSGEKKDLIGSAAMLEVGTGDLAITSWIDITENKRAAEKLRASQEKFFKVFQGSPSAISITNLESGKLVEVNYRFEQLFGFSQDEVIGKSPVDVNIWKNSCDRDRLMEPYLKARQLHVEDLELLKKTGETIIADVNFVILEMAGVDHSIAIVSDITNRKQAENRVQQYQNRLKALASQLTIAEEKERKRIALELHDNIGQTLALLRLQLARSKKYASEDKLKTILDKISQEVLKTIRQTRELMFDLSSPVLNQIGLPQAIVNWLEERIAKKYDIKISFTDNSRGIVLDDDLTAILFRNIKELLINVVKHAKASQIDLYLENNNSELTIVVRDNGIGFSSDELLEGVDSGINFGLFSIKERMDDFGGKFAITSAPGKGCTAVLSVPTHEKRRKERNDSYYPAGR